MSYFDDIQPFVQGYVRPHTRLIFSNDDRIDFRNVKQEKGTSIIGKPLGLWYSIGDEWMKWCLENEVNHLIEGKNIFKICICVDFTGYPYVLMKQFRNFYFGNKLIISCNVTI